MMAQRGLCPQLLGDADQRAPRHERLPSSTLSVRFRSPGHAVRFSRGVKDIPVSQK